jgi:methionyl-tRNA synthetase
MIHQYRGGKVPAAEGTSASKVAEAARASLEAVVAAFDRFEFSKGLEAVWSLLSTVDKFIVEQAPWILAKKTDAESQARLDAALYTSAEALRIATLLLHPALPDATTRIWRQLGMTQPLASQRLQEISWGQLEAGQQVAEVAAVFPRLDAKPAIEKMRELEAQETARQAALLGKPAPAPQAQADVSAETIAIDDFAKVDLRVGQVVSAERVKGADKLLAMKVDIGEAEPRSIVAGIALAYQPEALVGRKVVIVANLQPRKLRGIESKGMIVAASLEGGAPVLAGFLEDVPVGARLK